jgi:pyruvate/2-oxoglutarate dehydrogenase complex dihydrolipoamide acyltransferase (E2) component
VPEVNVHWVVDRTVPQPGVDISVVVSGPTGDEGDLFAALPVIPGADRLSLEQLVASVHQLTTKARDGRLRPVDCRGGSFRYILYINTFISIIFN